MGLRILRLPCVVVVTLQNYSFSWNFRYLFGFSFLPVNCFLKLSKKTLPAHCSAGRQDEFEFFCRFVYSTVTDFAKLRGWSTLQPRITAMWYESNCSGITAKSGTRASWQAGISMV